ncbi:hypothetical protein DIC82_16450 [Clostridium beijerinckii]|nr:hypothetical protein DIC82_16450 [Clostridium beijerinckii]
MKSNLVKKIMVLTITVTTLLTTLPIGASASWKQDSKGWWNTEGNSYSVGWKQIDSKWYYFDQSGYMSHNTIIDEYYINSKGIAVSTTKGDIPIKIPSNWIQLDNKKAVAYVIDSKSDFIYDTTDTFGGSEGTFINGMKYGITKGLSEIEASEKNYNGKNATCLEYTLTTDSKIKKACDILFFKNNKVYCFNVTSSIHDFDDAKQQLEDMLNLSLVL